MKHRRLIKRSITRRRLNWAGFRRVLVCLVLGAVMTVATSWGCALFAWKTSYYTGVQVAVDTRIADPNEYRPKELMEPGIMIVMGELVKVWATDENGNGWLMTRIVRKELADRYHYGWPLSAMTAVMGDAEANLPWEISDQLKQDFVCIDASFDFPTWFPERFQGKRPPLRPRWPGFFYSTLLYGGLAWLSVFARNDLRRRLRFRRGLCVQCKYPRGDFDICPECGLQGGNAT